MEFIRNLQRSLAQPAFSTLIIVLWSSSKYSSDSFWSLGIHFSLPDNEQRLWKIAFGASKNVEQWSVFQLSKMFRRFVWPDPGAISLWDFLKISSGKSETGPSDNTWKILWKLNLSLGLVQDKGCWHLIGINIAFGWDFRQSLMCRLEVCADRKVEQHSVHLNPSWMRIPSKGLRQLSSDP